MKQKVTLLAKGGICRVALDILSHSDYQILRICDDGNMGMDRLHSFIPCDMTIEQFVNSCSTDDLFFNCIGNYHSMKMRIAYSKLLRQKGCKSINIIHKDSSISDSFLCGDGNLICSNVVLNANVEIGNDNVFFSGTIIEHDSVIGDNVYFSPSVTLCGKTMVGNDVYFGPGAIIAAGVHIGSRVVIGAGSLVLKDVEDGSVIYGNGVKVRMNDLW